MPESKFAILVKRVVEISQKKAFRNLVAAGLILVTIAILGWMVYRQRDVLINYQWKINFVPLAGSVLFYAFALLMAVLLWIFILRALGSRANFWDHFRFYCISNLAKRLPGTVWYIVWRANLYRDLGLSSRLTSLASGIEVAISIISGAITLLVFSIPIIMVYQGGMWGLIILSAASLAFLHPRVLAWVVNRFTHQSIQFRYEDIFLWTGLNIMNWISGGVILFCTVATIYPIQFVSLGYTIGAWTIVGVLSTSLFFFPTNLGLNQLGISLLLSSIIPAPIAVIAAILNRILITTFELVIGLAIFAARKASN